MTRSQRTGPVRARGRVVLAAAVIALLVIAADQLSKAWAQANLPLNKRVPVIEGWLGFGLTKNTGATYNLLRGQNGFFELVTLVLLLLIAAILLRGLAPDRITVVALATILGGGLSNLIDRLRLSGVVDFILFRLWPADFNLADAAVRVGALGVLVTFALRQLRSRKLVLTEQKMHRSAADTTSTGQPPIKK